MIISERIPAVDSLYDISITIEELENTAKFYLSHGMESRALTLQKTINAFKLMRRTNKKQGVYSKEERKSYGRST